MGKGNLCRGHCLFECRDPPPPPLPPPPLLVFLILLLSFSSSLFFSSSPFCSSSPFFSSPPPYSSPPLLLFLLLPPLHLLLLSLSLALAVLTTYPFDYVQSTCSPSFHAHNKVQFDIIHPLQFRSPSLFLRLPGLPSRNFFTVPAPSILTIYPSHYSPRTLTTVTISGDYNLLRIY